SFTIFADGQRFKCFGCGAGGDVLDFLRLRHGVGLRAAAEMLAGGEVPLLESAPMVGANRDNRDNSAGIDRARAIWERAKPASGTPAERYLRSRGLHLQIPETIRFAALRYGTGGPEHPCLVAAVHDVDGALTGIQRTYLNAEGTGKLAVDKAKLSLGRVSGGAVQLAPAAASLVVCEGLEDGLTLQQELGQAVWAAAGASMLPNMQFPPLVQCVAIGGDGDDAGRAAAGKAARAFALRGLAVRTFFPAAPHKDFNDMLLKGDAQ
ncbi:MAG: toprim domain-containing protein, partial [Croceibacterium sp.]